MSSRLATIALFGPFLGCWSTDDLTLPASVPDVAVEAAEGHEHTPAATLPVTVEVVLDGEPSPDTLVVQGGNPARWTTGADGTALVDVDLTVRGDLFLMASHPDARITGNWVDPESTDPVVITLTRFDRSDNPAYTFQDPGEPGKSDVTEKCAHCHVTINEAWWDSPHKRSASNPAVQDIYSGTAAASGEAACLARGGAWTVGLEPGTRKPVSRCVVEKGVVPLGAPGFGGCADCHAPGIDGQIGGRDLSEATGFAYDYGVHCDVCHRVESLNPAGAPGVAGFLKLLRPLEVSKNESLGPWAPLTFTPDPDIANIRMGSVLRGHFHQSDFCAGCHEQEQLVLVPGAAADPVRWPGGRLPIHSTFSEWKAGPMNPAATCQSCHMPPDPTVKNAADQQIFLDADIGVVAGWIRPPGAVRRHSWVGPRQPESGMLRLAAAIFLETSVEGGVLTVKARLKNVGPGHAIPTGEPLRSLVLLVSASCDGQPLTATGGDAVPDFGGYLARKVAGEDWATWPGAAVGQVVRVVTRTGGFHDYEGFGPFGDGRFDAKAKGMPIEHVAGEARITAVDGDAVTLDRPLPKGDVAYLGEGTALPESDDKATARAGAPGFAFARVLEGDDGRRMVPHYLAVDVASDNRLLPQRSWTSTHRFDATCAAPTASAVLVHRAWPLWLAAERGWDLRESVMEATSR